LKPFTVCMYGAASNDIDIKYFRQVESFGREIGRRGYTLIYGGGGSGLMGAAARGVRAESGVVISVIPRFMKENKDLFKDCTQTIWTDTMAERKTIMEDNADAFVVVPGGVGTFDEFFQILALATLKQHKAPIILFNIDGYFNTLIRLLDETKAKGFIESDIWQYVTVADQVRDIMTVLGKKAL